MLTDEEKGQVMIAHHKGQQIQRQGKNGDDSWQDEDAPAWNWIRYNYRIAPRQGYFVIETDKPHEVFATYESAQGRIKRYERRYPNARITELVPKT